MTKSYFYAQTGIRLSAYEFDKVLAEYEAIKDCYIVTDFIQMWLLANVPGVSEYYVKTAERLAQKRYDFFKNSETYHPTWDECRIHCLLEHALELYESLGKIDHFRLAEIVDLVCDNILDVDPVNALAWAMYDVFYCGSCDGDYAECKARAQIIMEQYNEITYA